MCVICSSLDQVLARDAAGEALPDPTGSAGFALVSSQLSQASLSEGVDAADGTDTAYAVSVGDIFAGSIDPANDSDWIRITLEENESYVFVSFGVGGTTLGLNETLLTLRSETGVELAFNDDVAAEVGNFFSVIEYTATTSGTYYLDVQSYNGSEAGTYNLMTATDVFTVDQAATYISRVEWGAPVPIRLDVVTGGQISYNINNLTPAGQQLAEWAIEAWEIATGLDFVASNSVAPDIFFDDTQAGAFAGPNNLNPETGITTPDTGNRLPGASVNVGAGWLIENGTTVDSYSYQTYLHEIGHALGLGHAGPYDGSATFQDAAIYSNDSTLMSVMSYFSPEDNTNIPGGDVTILTPMLADLVVVHDFYGTPQAYAGDTVWGANSNIGGWLGTLSGVLFDGDTAPSWFYSGEDVALTLFDTGGTDTLDLSTVNVAQRIDLRPESVSNAGGIAGSLSIARDTIIENVIGGSGADNMTGNSANNRITGGAGNDIINGATGSDTAVMNVSQAEVSATQDDIWIQVVSGQGTDRYANVEFFAFTDGTISAAALLDLSETASEGDDILTGTDGNDTIDALAGNDTLHGGLGNDSLTGGAGADLIIAGDGDDMIVEGSGDDTIRGQAGSDTAIIGLGRSALSVTELDGGVRVVSALGSDTYTGVEFFALADGMFSLADLIVPPPVEPTTGADNLPGSPGNDTIDALAGDDTVQGGGGNDRLTGGTGNDSLNGGDGNDVFVEGPGDDTVRGASGIDVVLLNVTRASVTASVLPGGGVRIVSALGTDDYFGIESFAFDDGTVSGENLLALPGSVGILLQGTPGADTLTGTNGADTLVGQGGDDVINGLGGDDNLAASDGNDTVAGGSGRDAIGGGPGDDMIRGGPDSDTIGAGQGDDDARGGAGDDIVNGGVGNDLIDGGDGNDTIGAGFNNDTVFGGNGDDSLGGGAGQDQLDGGAGNDAIGAGEGDDTVIGGSGDDFLAGGGRSDVIRGGTGDDRINGGQGNDTLSGGAGADQFIFNNLTTGERDVIADFEDGSDMIRLRGVQNAPGSGLQGLVDALDITDTDQGAQLTHAGHVIVVENISAAQLGLADFVFV